MHLVKETANFTLLKNDEYNPYEIYHDEKRCNFYITSKEQGTIELGTDSYVMALIHLSQAEEGIKEAKLLFNNKNIPVEAEVVTH